MSQMKTPNDARLRAEELKDQIDTVRLDLIAGSNLKYNAIVAFIEQALTTYAEEKVNEAIEECAKVADSRCSDRTAKAIRELKAKQK